MLVDWAWGTCRKFQEIMIIEGQHWLPLDYHYFSVRLSVARLELSASASEVIRHAGAI